MAACSLILVNSLQAEETGQPTASGEPVVVATIGGETINSMALQRATAKLVRERYYHGKIPQDKVPELQREAVQQLVDRKLLAQEARRRGLKADQAEIKKRLHEVDLENSSNPELEEQWERLREDILQVFRTEMEEDDLKQQLKSAVEKKVKVSKDEVADYYALQPEKFTTPMQVSASMILIGVDPGAPTADWDKAEQQAEELLARLKQGADFAEIAREHSSHASAERGGNLGSLHQGMLTANAEAKLQELAVGEPSEVLRTLEGATIMRVDERIPPKLNAFEDVEERATSLALRKAREITWERLIEDLREATPVSLNEAMLGGPASQP